MHLLRVARGAGRIATRLSLGLRDGGGVAAVGAVIMRAGPGSCSEVSSSYQWVFHRDCTLEAMRAQGAFPNFFTCFISGEPLFASQNHQRIDIRRAERGNKARQGRHRQ